MKRLIFACLVLLFGGYAQVNSNVAYAQGFNRYDISGLTLGTPYDLIKKNLPCASLDANNSNSYGVALNYWVFCGVKLDYAAGGTTFNVELSNEVQKKILSVNRTIVFSENPNSDQVTGKLYEKYGKPKETFKINSNNEYFIGEVFGMCWGDCKLNQEKDGFSVAKGNMLTAYLNLVEYSYQREGKEWYLTLSLSNHQQSENNSKRFENMIESEKVKIRARERSGLSF